MELDLRYYEYSFAEEIEELKNVLNSNKCKGANKDENKDKMEQKDIDITLYLLNLVGKTSRSYSKQKKSSKEIDLINELEQYRMLTKNTKIILSISMILVIIGFLRLCLWPILK